MRVDYLILADSVAVAEGKHYIHGGGWDTLFAPSFPAFHPVLGVAARLRVLAEETGQQLAVEVDVQGGEEGSSILPEPLRGIVSAERQPHLPPDSDLLLHLALSFTNLQFESPGSYNIVLRIDGQPLAESRFNVLALPRLPE
jgi:Family of unknown function (DUF6941)